MFDVNKHLSYDLNLLGRPWGHPRPCSDKIWAPYFKPFPRYEFFSSTFGLVTDVQTDSNVYEPTVHGQ